MSQTSPALAALFADIAAGRNLTWCYVELYTIVCPGGPTLRYNNSDFDINCGSGTSFVGLPNPAGLYASSGVRVDQDSSKGTKTQFHLKRGVDTDTYIVALMPRPVDIITGALFPDQIGSVPWVEAADGGALDAADFQVDRAYFASVPTWPMPPTGMVPVGTKTVFAGTIAEVDTSDLPVIVTANDYRMLMTQSMPRQCYQAQCRWLLFGVGCNADGLSRATYAVNGTVGAGSTPGNIVAPGLATPGGSGTYALGTIVMTSGLNNGFSATVTSWDGTNLALVAPLPFDVAVGDTFSAAPGCDLTQATCAQFGNSNNFGGMPFIPPPETALAG